MSPSPPSAGYSGTPLPKKLGIKPGHRLLVLAAPPGYPAAFGPLPDGVIVHEAPDDGRYDVIVAFTTAAAALVAALPDLRSRLLDHGGLWISWPKKAAKRPTDLDENQVRAAALAIGLVDNKVCAVDQTWSGLRLVVRVADRAKAPRKPAKP